MGLKEGAIGIRVLIVDDHRLFADVIRSALQEQGMEVVGVATTGREALVLDGEPDVVIIDLGLPDESGVEVGRKVLERHPLAKVLAVTALTDPGCVSEALQAGFHGYLTKETPLAQLVAAIEAALAGQVVVPHRLAAAAAGARSRNGDGVMLLAGQLSRRERQVLELLVEGETSEGLAKRLGVKPNTVRTHIQSILTKLQVHSRLEAATFAVRHGLVSPPGNQRKAT